MTTLCSRLNANKMTYPPCIPYSNLLTGRACQDVSIVQSDSTLEVADRIVV